MALTASDVAMRDIEWKLRKIVAEYGRFPGSRDVAGRTIFIAPGGLELSSVDVGGLVTSGAPAGGIGELGCGLCSNVTLNALDFEMRSFNPEPGCGMVERLHGSPLFRGVAGLARNLSLVRIGVTCCTV
jgi:hypothetical protein